MGTVFAHISVCIILFSFTACNTLSESEEKSFRDSGSTSNSKKPESQYTVNTEELNRIFHTHYGEDMTLAEHAHQNIELLNYLQRSQSVFLQKRRAGYEARQKARQKRIKKALDRGTMDTSSSENGVAEQ
ncbi:MAG: hypothetical protein ACQEQ4_00505 [Fibrobacterota bacterium]